MIVDYKVNVEVKGGSVLISVIKHMSNTFGTVSLTVFMREVAIRNGDIYEVRSRQIIQEDIFLGLEKKLSFNSLLNTINSLLMEYGRNNQLIDKKIDYFFKTEKCEDMKYYLDVHDNSPVGIKIYGKTLLISCYEGFDLDNIVKDAKTALRVGVEALGSTHNEIENIHWEFSKYGRYILNKDDFFA